MCDTDRRKEQYDLLFGKDVQFYEDDDPEQVLSELKESRKAVAENRRAKINGKD